MTYSRKADIFSAKKAITPLNTWGYRIPSLVDWDMCTDRNLAVCILCGSLSLVDWDMCTDRNSPPSIKINSTSLVDWDMCTDRNLETIRRA